MSQTNLPKKGNDLDQIIRIKNNQAQLAIIQLSSLAKMLDKKNKNYLLSYNNVCPIFPNQRKKGTYYKISGAGIYRYAKNPQNAKKMLEFLASKRAQYLFASGRYEIPVVKGVDICYQVKNFGKYRARFYHKRYKIKKRP